MNASTVNSPARKPNLDIKLKVYNEYHKKINNSSMIIHTKEENNRQVLAGLLKIHWGDIKQQIHLKPEDDSKVTKRDWRRSTIATFPRVNSGLSVYGEVYNDVSGFAGDLAVGSNQNDECEEINDDWQKTIAGKGYTFTKATRRIDRRRQNRDHRRSIINGHIFDVDTSIFKPSAGVVTTVTVTSDCLVSNVIRLLFDKFKVLNDPKNFCLCINKLNGERHLLQDNDCPLVQKILMGPIDEDNKVVLMDREGVQEVSEQVAPYFILPEAVLIGFLEALKKEQDQEEATIKARYQVRMQPILDRIKVLENGVLV